MRKCPMAHTTNFIIYFQLFTDYSLKSSVCSLLSEVWRLQSEVYSLKSSVYSLKSGVYSLTPKTYLTSNAPVPTVNPSAINSTEYLPGL